MKKILLFALLVTSHHLMYAQAGEWTWMNGDSIANQDGVLGSQGIPSPDNTPRALADVARWTDLQGNFWLYGGRFGSNYYADMWRFNPITSEWTWMSGTGTQVYLPGYWGTQGVASSMNNPGPRAWGSATWVDTSGSFWLLGGYGIAVDSYESRLCDLWKYDPGTNEWTWMNGPNAGDEPGVYGSLGVPSAANHPAGLFMAYSTWSDTENNLWLYCGRDAVYFRRIMWKYSVTDNLWTWMSGDTLSNPATYGTLYIYSPASNPGARTSCAPFKDAEDNFYFFAGQGTADFYNDLWKYNHTLNSWAWMGGQQNWNQPGDSGAICEESTQFVPNKRSNNTQCWWDDCGNVWFYGGNENGYNNPLHSDLWHLNLNTVELSHVNGTLNSGNYAGFYGIKGLSSSFNHPPAKMLGASWMDSQGRLWMFGGLCTDQFATINDMWMYVPDTSCTYITCQPPSPVSFDCSAKNFCEKFCTDFTDSSTNDPFAWQWIFPGGDPSSSTLQNPTNICYDLPGTYDVTLITTSANGSDTLTLPNYITVYPTPPFPTITQAGYTLTSSPASSYQWQFNSADIAGATNQSYDVMQTGFYTVIVGDSNSCKNSTTVYVLISGVEEVGDGSFFISPNPSNGSFTLELLNGFIAGEVSIDVVNTLGQKIFSSNQKISSTKLTKEIDLHDTASGLYFIEIKSNGVFVRKKIIVTK